MEWTAEFTVGFVPLPPEKEAAFYASMDYFAKIIFQELTAPRAELEAVKTDEKKRGVCASLLINIQPFFVFVRTWSQL